MASEESWDIARPLDLGDSPAVMVSSKDDLTSMVEDISQARAIGVDVEHHASHCYSGITCLMQISTGETDYIVDTMALFDHIGPALSPLFSDPNVVKVLHGGANDVLWLQRDFNLRFKNVFDTEKACQVLGRDQRSWGHLLRDYCGIVSDKSMQLSDWRMRPLTRDQLEYARLDVHYLVFVARQLCAELSILQAPVVKPGSHPSHTQTAPSADQVEAKPPEEAFEYLYQPAGAALPPMLAQAVQKSRRVSDREYVRPTHEEAVDHVAGHLLRQHFAHRERRDATGVPSNLSPAGPAAHSLLQDEILRDCVHALCAWRDTEARAVDIGVQLTLPDVLLMSMALQRPSSPAALHKLIMSAALPLPAPPSTTAPHPASASAPSCSVTGKQQGLCGEGVAVGLAGCRKQLATALSSAASMGTLMIASTATAGVALVRGAKPQLGHQLLSMPLITSTLVGVAASWQLWRRVSHGAQQQASLGVKRRWVQMFPPDRAQVLVDVIRRATRGEVSWSQFNCQSSGASRYSGDAKKVNQNRRQLRIKQFSAKSKVYQNCKMLSENGELLCHCDLRKLEWYVAKGIAVKVSDDPPTIKLLFPHKNSDQLIGTDDFYSQSKENKCVACGEESHYLRYKVVPACYRKNFPMELKSHRSHDVVLLCFDCHQVAQRAAECVKRQLAEELDIPLMPPTMKGHLGNSCAEQGSQQERAEGAKVDADAEAGRGTEAPRRMRPEEGRRAAIALSRSREVMPEERVRALEATIKMVLGRDPEAEPEGLLCGDLETAMLMGLGQRRQAKILKKAQQKRHYRAVEGEGDGGGGRVESVQIDEDGDESCPESQADEPGGNKEEHVSGDREAVSKGAGRPANAETASTGLSASTATELPASTATGMRSNAATEVPDSSATGPTANPDGVVNTGGTGCSNSTETHSPSARFPPTEARSPTARLLSTESRSPTAQVPSTGAYNDAASLHPLKSRVPDGLAQAEQLVQAEPSALGGGGHSWHGAKVVASLLEAEGVEGLHRLARRFRTAFVSACQPKFLPPNWGVDHTASRKFGDFSIYQGEGKRAPEPVLSVSA